MNAILVCLFVFTLGSLAAQVPTDVDKNDALDPQNEESSQDFSSVAQDDSHITKRSAEKPGRWHKANDSPVCFGARSNQPGTFRVPFGGKLAAVKLVHLYGYVSCDIRNVNHWSFWGCGHHGSVRDLVNVAITRTTSNYILFPPTQFMVFAHRAGKWAKVPGYNSFSKEIVLSRFYSPLTVRSGYYYRLWYGEDLVNYTEGDNGGRVCADVYALYV